jgi:hypothetical protein
MKLGTPIFFYTHVHVEVSTTVMEPLTEPDTNQSPHVVSCNIHHIHHHHNHCYRYCRHATLCCARSANSNDDWTSFISRRNSLTHREHPVLLYFLFAHPFATCRVVVEPKAWPHTLSAAYAFTLARTWAATRAITANIVETLPSKPCP